MKTNLGIALTLSFLAASCMAQEIRTFSNAEGKTLEDRILKYDYAEHVVTLDKKGPIPLATFSEADQSYILHWNQIEGFKSTMRFKMDVEKGNWARLKHEQNITPYFMDAIQIPGKKTPNHHIIMAEDYEEYNAVYLEAEGFSVTLRNQNFFPLENLVVESKIYYEQEQYVITDSLFSSAQNEYADTVTTNKVRFLSETIPIIIPREEVVMNSECAFIVDHQVARSTLVSTTNEEGDEETEESIEGFGDWDDHGRRRKGRVIGVWFRIGMKDPDGEMVWREITSPSSLASEVSWEQETADAGLEQAADML